MKRIFISLLLCPLSMMAMSEKYVMITDIGGDIDDALALKTAFNLNRPPQCIITTHNKPLEKAQIAKIIAIRSGFPDVPVYVGAGCTPESNREKFTTENKLWPSFFGYLNPEENERQWNPTQAKAYRDTFGQEFDQTAQSVQKKSNDCDRAASDHLIALAQNCGSNEILDIVALAPLHDVYNALRAVNAYEGDQAECQVAQKMRLWTMGGDYPQGYNWLIAPDVTNYVLKRVKSVCISSALIRDNALNVLPREFAVFAKATKGNSNPSAEAIFKDWVNWNKDDQLKNDKNLCDPVTLYAYLNPEIIEEMKAMAVTFPCLTQPGELREDLKGTAYCAKGLEGKIISITPDAQGNVSFVHKIKDAPTVRRKLIYHIAQIFFPSVDEATWWQHMDNQQLSPEQIAHNIELLPALAEKARNEERAKLYNENSKI